MDRLWIGLGGFAGLSAVATAAVAAHGLPERLDPAALQLVRNALQMHGWHALALVACGLWAERGGPLAHAAAFAFVLGLLLFCGAVYSLALFGARTGPMAPAGGIALMIGWALLALSALRRPARPSGG